MALKQLSDGRIIDDWSDRMNIPASKRTPTKPGAKVGPDRFSQWKSLIQSPGGVDLVLAELTREIEIGIERKRLEASRKGKRFNVPEKWTRALQDLKRSELERTINSDESEWLTWRERLRERMTARRFFG